MKDLSSSLGRIDHGLPALRRDDTRSFLQAGISAEYIQAEMTRLGVPPVDDLIGIYAWHNGVESAGEQTIDQLCLFPGFYLLSLEDAMLNYKTFRDDRRWRSTWFPVFANGGGDFYVVDLGVDELGLVRHFRIDEQEHPVEFGSLRAMMRTIAEAFTDGTFFIDVGGYLEMDDLAFASLAARLNPDVPWWQD